jgi:hypothetical protein
MKKGYNTEQAKNHRPRAKLSGFSSVFRPLQFLGVQNLNSCCTYYEGGRVFSDNPKSGLLIARAIQFSGKIMVENPMAAQPFNFRSCI